MKLLDSIHFIAGVMIGIVLMGIVASYVILNEPVPNQKIVIVENMTCIEYNGSLTCNWDEWERAQ